MRTNALGVRHERTIDRVHRWSTTRRLLDIRVTSSPLRVCLVTPSFSPDLGGLASIVAGLAVALTDAGCEVEVATQVIARLSRGVASPDAVPVHRFPTVVGGRRFGYAPRLTAWVRKNQDRFDVVHAFSYHAPVALSAALSVSRPFVFTPTFHGGGHSPLARVVHVGYRRVSGRLVRSSRAIICGSRAERDAFVAEFPAAASRVIVIPFAVEGRALADAEPYAVDEPVILVAGRLDDYKRNDVVVAAMSDVSMSARLVVCGDGPDRSRLESIARDRGVSDHVDLLGYVTDDELARWRATASVVATLSTHESFGLSLVEGAASGAPLVLSDIGPHREVVDMLGATAEFVPVDSAGPVVAHALDAALARPRSPHRLALPTWADRARETVAVYESLQRADRPL